MVAEEQCVVYDKSADELYVCIRQHLERIKMHMLCIGMEIESMRSGMKAGGGRYAQGVCTGCGGPNDQLPYHKCSRCYEPHPRQSMFGVPANTLEYRRQYRHYQNGTPFYSCATLACYCGKEHPITHVPFTTPCCGYTFLEERP